MLTLLRIFFIGIAISFIGALPLGTVNLAALQIALTDGLSPAILFSLGLLVPDLFYVLLTLLAMQWIQKQKRLFKALEWITLLIVVALAVGNFYAAFHPSAQKNVLLSNNIPRFLLGIIMNGVNPMQIPFWFGWSTVLFTRKWLEQRWKHYLVYATGAAVGMFAGTALFIFGGRLLADTISSNQKVLYGIVGGFFSFTALYQAWKMQKNKNVGEKMKQPEKVVSPYADVIQELDNTNPYKV